MIRHLLIMGVGAAVAFGGNLSTRAEDLVPIDLQLPAAAFSGTPAEIVSNEHLEKISEKDRPPFLAPKGVKNLALGKKVTSSDKSPMSGSLDLVTDGDKESNDSSYVELRRKLQWVQIDLEAPHEIYAIVFWHAHSIAHVYTAVVVQVADDAEFSQNVRTLFNNDYENVSGLGTGQDKQYYETHEGKLVDAKGQKARYVRLYSKGSTYSPLNRYTEVEVYGK